jgi:UDP-N-acetylmuramyl pentapeptide phosphotransferase/UDP-N-acetylglucosamine-1-phosphate transferase
MPSIPYLVTVVLLGGAGWGLSLLATGFSIRLAEKRQLLAEVNHRSSHRVPTPRVGGIGIIVGLLPALLLLSIGQATDLGALLSYGEGFFGWTEQAVLLVGLLLAFALGFWDDVRNAPAWAKLGGQLLLAIAPPLLGLRLQAIHLPGMEEPYPLSPAISIPITAAWIVYVMNAVNFMDGINGIAGLFGQYVAVATGAAIFNFAGAGEVLVLCVGLGAALAGFLHYNTPKARTFMGDCGSQPLGFLLAILGVQVANAPVSYPLPFLGYVLILSPFLYDVGVTLVKRALERKRLMDAHREHLFQRHLAATGEDHEFTLWWFTGIHLATAICGALYLRFAWQPTALAWQAALVTATLLALGYYTFGVLRAEDRQAALQR